MKDSQTKFSSELIEENKDFIYPILFYLSGLILGSVFYSVTKGGLNGFLKIIYNTSQINILSMFIGRCGLYLFIFSFTLLLSICLVGFKFINLIPLISGIALSIKISYYCFFGIKGFLRSLLLVVPETAVYITIIIFTIKNCSTLSRKIYDSTLKKSDMTCDLSIKSYLKTFIIYALLLVATAFINSILTYLLRNIIPPM